MSYICDKLVKQSAIIMKSFLLPFFFMMFCLSVKAQWESLSGPYLSSEYISMDVEKLAATDNLVYAIIDNKVHLSANYGHSWMLMHSDGNYIKSIAAKDSMVIAGTAGNGILMSQNYGCSFHQIGNGLPLQTIVDEIMIKDETIFAIVDDFISAPYPKDLYFSNDSGQSWNLVQDLAGKRVNCITSENSVCYAGTNDGIFISSDNGQSWISIGPANGTINSIAVRDGEIYAGENNSGGVLYFSNNNGTSWTNLNTAHSIYAAGKIAIDDNYVYVCDGSAGVFRANRNSSIWTNVNNGFNLTTTQDILSHGNYLFVSSSNGIAISTNQGNYWVCDLKTYNLTIKAITYCNSSLIAATSYGIQRTLDLGNTWLQSLIGVNTIASGNDIVFAGANTSLLRSYDYGNIWSSTNVHGLPEDPYISALAIHDSTCVIGTLQNGIWVSENNGSFWECRSTGLNDQDFNVVLFYNSQIYAGSENSGVYSSVDNGQNWFSCSDGLYDSSVVAIARCGNSLFSGTKSGIFRLNSDGNIWVKKETILPDSALSCLTAFNNNLFAGYDGYGICISPDFGDSWFVCNENLYNQNISCLLIVDSVLYAGTTGGGVWKRHLSEFPLDTTRETQINTEEIISNIFPNPSDEYVIITPYFSNSNIHLTMFNTAGQKVLQFTFPPNEIRLNIEKFNYGVYFLNFRRDRLNETHTIIIR